MPPEQPPQHSANPLVATAVWKISTELVIALDDRFGEPLDSYVNGSQVWLRPDGLNKETIEYRLHPVADYVKPAGVPTDEVLSQTALACAEGTDPPAPPEALWDGLEAFVAFDDEGPFTPEALADIGRETLGIEPTIWGLVDHEGIAQRWERSARNTSIVGELLAQLRSGNSSNGGD